MPRARRRKIEVPTGDTQPQFALGDTAEDIERRRERMRERGESRKRVTERGLKRKKGERREREQTPH